MLFRRHHHHWGWKKILRHVSGFFFHTHPLPKNQTAVSESRFYFFETKTFLSDHFHVYSALTWQNAKYKKIDTLVCLSLLSKWNCVNYFSCTDNFFSIIALSTTNADDNNDNNASERARRESKAAQNGLKKSVMKKVR